MAYLTQNRTVFCYDNVVSPENITAVTSTNITADTGFPLNNLLYPDPRLILRVSTTNASDRIITYQFAAAQTISCMGLAAHDLVTRGYQNVKVEWSDNGSSWTNVGTGTLTLPVVGNMNFFVRFDSLTKIWWRVTLGMTSGTRPAFEVGMIFLGKYYELSRNAVVDGGFIVRRSVPLYILDTAGGDRLALPVPRRVIEDSEISLSRIALVDRLILGQSIVQGNAGRIIGIIQPNQVTTQSPVVEPHLWGYVQEDVGAVRVAFPNPQYDVTLRFMGAA